MTKLTSKEIAKMVGVSPSAISIVMNNRKGVSNETRNKVLGVLEENNIAPKAKNLSRSVIKFCKIEKHGQIINNHHDVFISDYFNGIVEESQVLGMSAEFESFSIGSMKEIRKELESEQGVAGYIILGTELEAEDIMELSPLSTPHIFLDTYWPFCDETFITMDNFSMVFDVIKELKKLGHSSIGMFTSYGCGNFVCRESAFLESMTNLFGGYDRSLIVPVSSTHIGSYQDVLEYLKTDPTLPTAFFCCNDIVAIGAQKAFQERGYCIPTQILLIGFDDLPSSSLVFPPLPTVSVPKKEIGGECANILYRKIHNPSCRKISQKVFVAGKLIMR